MDKIYKTEQEYFWAGEFGNEYIKRNTREKLLPSYLNLWSEIISKTSGIKSCLEFGANIGVNLQALKLLIPDLDM
ncbi:MAG: pseudaminic acid biosynthesis-associated methylase, partial [Alphaproteobacteria bacterium]|nr:pseudaminic acid biosynthesis-associated methylase [Alphaproteobacteria bacterium]